MMRIYKSPAAETVMVGDSNADLQGSGNAGIPHRLAFISPDYTGQAFTDQVIAMRKSGSTAHFSDYRQLPGIIESLTI